MASSIDFISMSGHVQTSITPDADKWSCFQMVLNEMGITDQKATAKWMEIRQHVGPPSQSTLGKERQLFHQMHSVWKLSRENIQDFSSAKIISALFQHALYPRRYSKCRLNPHSYNENIRFQVANEIARKKPRLITEQIGKYRLSEGHRFIVAKEAVKKSRYMIRYFREYQLSEQHRYELWETLAIEYRKYFSSMPYIILLRSGLKGAQRLKLIKLVSENSIPQSFTDKQKETLLSYFDTIGEGEDLRHHSENLKFLSAMIDHFSLRHSREVIDVNEQQYLDHVVNLSSKVIAFRCPEIKHSMAVLLQYYKPEHKEIIDSLGQNFKLRRDWVSLVKLPLVKLQSDGVDTKVIDDLCALSKFKDNQRGAVLIKVLVRIALEQHLSPLEKSSILAKCCHVEGRNRMEKEMLFLKNLQQADAIIGIGEIQSLKDPAISLGECFVASFKKHIPIQNVEDFEDKYLTIVNTVRQPHALIRYASDIKRLGDDKATAAYIRIVEGVLNDTLTEQRYQLEGNPHLQKIHAYDPEMLAKWKQSKECSLDLGGARVYQDIKGRTHVMTSKEAEVLSRYVVVDTDESIELHLSGTDVPGSCQKIGRNPDTNAGLLGLQLHGQTRMIAIKDKKGPMGKIVGRCLFRLLWDGEKPVLFLEGYYGDARRGGLYIKAIIERAKKRADELGVELTSHHFGNGDLYQRDLYSLGGPAPYEYVDSAGGICADGKFRIKGCQKVRVL